MANFYIITNNPNVCKKHSPIAVYQEGTVAGIFTAVRDAVHKGAVLISHPLAGSIKPNESPYKSVMLSTRQGSLDERSLSLIEGAVAVLRKLPEKQRQYPQRALEDFRVIDLDLMDSALLALPAEYYYAATGRPLQ